VAHADAAHARGAGERRALAVALALIAAFTVAELVSALLAGSLALLADAGHMLSDTGSLALALFASWLATHPATPARSFGYRRAEILAALANGVALVAIAIWVFIEAAGRFSHPPDVSGRWVLVIGLIGLAVNVAAAGVLYRAGTASLNVRAALLHVAADGLGSIGVLAAAVVILATGWLYADPLAGVVIGGLVLASSWRVLRESVRILLEATPEGVDAVEVGRTMTGEPDVVEVHDLHIWTITTGFPALAAHVLVERGADCHAVRRRLERLLAERFALDHTTLQVEHVGESDGAVPLGRPFRRRSPLRRHG
jgi:cobalt-zinc-cadmium efflux system protein